MVERNVYKHELKLLMEKNIRVYDNFEYSIKFKMARVELEGKYGVVNNEGEEIVPVKYDGIAFLKSHHILGWSGTHYRLFNGNGIILIEREYENLQTALDNIGVL